MSVEIRSGQGRLRSGSETAVASRDGLATGEPQARDGPFACKLRLIAVGQKTELRRRVAGWSDSAGETSRRPNSKPRPTAVSSDELLSRRFVRGWRSILFGTGSEFRPAGTRSLSCPCPHTN
jgi:hypothetical protein